MIESRKPTCIRANTIIEGHNLVKPSDDFKKEVASTSEKMSVRDSQFDKLVASAGCHFTVLSRIIITPVQFPATCRGVGCWRISGIELICYLNLKCVTSRSVIEIVLLQIFGALIISAVPGMPSHPLLYRSVYQRYELDHDASRATYSYSRHNICSTAAFLDCHLETIVECDRN